MPEETVNTQTRAEWRDLGFFFAFREPAKAWHIIGDRGGLQGLCDLLRRYAFDPRHAGLSEHEHFGPYSDLKFVTWSTCAIKADGIYGRLPDFVRLAVLIEKSFEAKQIGQTIIIDEDYASVNEAKLEVTLAADHFDPASADQSLRN